MKYLLFFLLSSLLFLSKAVVALKESKPSETLYFYQAYLVEFKTRDSKRRTIAKTCSKTDTPCTYPAFLRHILSQDSWRKISQDSKFTAIRTIIETADTTDVITTSRRLREKNFDPKYDFSQLLEGTSKSSQFGPIFEKIDGLIRDQLGSDKVAEHRKPMADALDLIQKHRIANNMKYFIAELKQELGIEKLALQDPNPKTPDGFSYQAYDTAKTVEQLEKSAKNEADPEKKAKINAQADGLAAKMQELVIKIRSPNYKEKIKNNEELNTFKRHQAVIFRAKNTLKLLQKIEKGGKC
ncbi:uncharacterized protein NFIA_021290 [Aspergillus fischeri NRRL 181]|uniref:Uncharacterized protein n=1 Tax=Neosartorya fischeri (strain ATCC 1020 / DSM 3700 / CBS 544.65 / FGSC A1164 / JCM 1740 / NRRL 181 / WB 181) TaxID=331117 RepID=A1D4S8_NEOFI|nr:conserved hypothetical protein [Aspergillus fischeri NRRL 181]EAW23421.1 conserved hypothetical protein [Aspergillus fischeri NRRL 181]KAG2027792.1 hypothetical protein GB937_000235 [Aspergillus fischeri]